MSRKRFSKFALAAFLAYWMLFGGSLFWFGWTPLLFVASMGIMYIWAARSLPRSRLPALLGPALLLFLASLISMLANLDIFWTGVARLLVGLTGIMALLAGAGTKTDELLDILFISGWIWLPGWVLLRSVDWVDNRNLAAVWPMVMILVILVKRKPVWLALPFLAALVFLGSRGAILGLGLGLLAWKRPQLNWKKAALVAVVGVAALGVLALVRPQNAFNRILYWDQVANALEGGRIWLGVGPGGLFARHMIVEPGSNPPRYHVHAHNLLVQVLAESGLVGALAFLAAMIWILQAGVRRGRQAPVLIAILGHCLVDFPLYFPGPLLVFMLLAGSLPGRDLLTPVLAVLKAGLAPVSVGRYSTNRAGRSLPSGSLVPNTIHSEATRPLDRSRQSRQR